MSNTLKYSNLDNPKYGIGNTLNYLISDLQPDAALNLYEIQFEPIINDFRYSKVESKFKNNNFPVIYSYRTNYFQIPKMASTTTFINYQNVEIPVVSSGSDQDKILNFTLRIDSEYLLLKAFEESLNVDANGYFDYNNGLNWNIKVYAYKNNMNGSSLDFIDDNVARIWRFDNCKITNIQSFNLDYNSSEAPTTTVSFIWGIVKDSND